MTKVPENMSSTVLIVPKGRNEKRKELKVTHYDCWERGLSQYEVGAGKPETKEVTSDVGNTA